MSLENAGQSSGCSLLSQVHLADSNHTPEPIPKAACSREPTLIPE